MLDAAVRRWLERLLARAGRWAGAHVSADVVTWVGFACGAAAAILVAADLAPAGLAFFALNRMADGLDGAIARERGSTAVGAFLDVALDLIVYAGLAFAFAIREPTAVIAVAFFLFGFASMMMTELSLRYFAGPPRVAAAPVLRSKVSLQGTPSGGSSPAESKKIVEDILTELDAAVKRGEELKLSPLGTFKVRQKRPRLSPPLIGHTETAVVLAVACAYPPAFPVLAYVYGAACFIASGVRIANGMEHLKAVER